MSGAVALVERFEVDELHGERRAFRPTTTEFRLVHCTSTERARCKTLEFAQGVFYRASNGATGRPGELGFIL